MSDEIDVDALLDAPFKHKVVEDQSAKADAQMNQNAKVEPAHAEDAKTRVERKDTERGVRRSQSRSSRREHRDDRYRDSYRHSRHDRDSYRHSRHDRDRYYDRHERQSSRHSSSRYRQRSSSPPRSLSRDRRS
ncbi:hypothetical protein EV176_007025, partial [Coemansia sp. RSA 451]